MLYIYKWFLLNTKDWFITTVEGNMILNRGGQEKTCIIYTVKAWSAEFTGRHVGAWPKGYSIFCGKGKVQLPLLREPPQEKNGLITLRGLKCILQQESGLQQPFCFLLFWG